MSKGDECNSEKVGNVFDVLYSDQASTDLTIKGKKHKFYSLLHVGDAWKKIMEQSNMEGKLTLLGQGIPDFQVEKADNIQIPTLEIGMSSRNSNELSENFGKLADDMGYTTDKYDYRVFVYHFTNNSLPSRAFARGVDSFVFERPLTTPGSHNRTFTTIVHELGHTMLGLRDLYDGFGLTQAAVPDPNQDGIIDPNTELPATKACIMGGAGKFAVSFHADNGLFSTQDDEKGYYVENILMCKSSQEQAVNNVPRDCSYSVKQNDGGFSNKRLTTVTGKYWSVGNAEECKLKCEEFKDLLISSKDIIPGQDNSIVCSYRTAGSARNKFTQDLLEFPI